jgi:hypothetical protein
MIIHFDFSAAELAAAPRATLEGCVSEAKRLKFLSPKLIIPLLS